MHTIKISHKPWYVWLTWALWLFLELFFLQCALASKQELEPRAAALCWLIFSVLLLGGIVFWLIRRNRLI